MNTKIKILLFSLATFFAWGGLVRAATIDSEEQNFVDLLNAYRKSLGRTELKISKPVTNGAEYFAQDFADHPDDADVNIHKDTQGRGPEERGKHYGYYFLTENMGWGYETGQQIFDAWKGSSGHKENMINSGGRTIGIARVNKPGATKDGQLTEWFWVMDISDEGVERLIGNNLQDSEMYTTPYRKMSFTVRKYSKKYKKYKAAKSAEVKVYDGSRLLDHDVADKKGKCSVYMLGSSKNVTLKIASFKGKSATNFTIGNKRSKSKSINWNKNLKYTVKL